MVLTPIEMKKKPLLTDEQRLAVNRAVADAERRTSADILPAVARASGRYDRAEDVVGVWFGLVLCAVLWYFFQGVGSSAGWNATSELRLAFWIVAAVIVVGFVVGAIVAGRVFWLRRLFTSTLEMDQETVARAKAVFYDSRVHRTSDGSGVLVFVSLYERRAAILADERIVAKLSERSLEEVRDELIDGITENGLAGGLCQGIERLGRLLESALPADESVGNEVHNEVVVLE